MRFVYDNNYFNADFQGIPVGGSTAMVEKMLDGIEVRTGVDYFADREYYDSLADKIVFTGMIERFFEEKYGSLEYRSLSFVLSNNKSNKGEYGK